MIHSDILGFVFTAAGYVVGSVVFCLFSKTRGFDGRQSGWLLVSALFGGIAGAKLTRLVFAVTSGASPESILAHPDGRTIIGGILFGWVAVEAAKNRLKLKRSTGDAFALALSSGEAIGRIGCFFNGCCYGAISSVPWAVYQAGAWRHPSQLYSAGVALAIFLILYFLRGRVTFEGDLFRIYLLSYGLSRFGLEFFRQRSEIHFGLSMAQWVSLEIALAMLIALAWQHYSQHKLNGAVAVDGREIL
jgi:phosphatidylglycerol:prolipoprotein diacylglycerol transferase